MDQSAETVPRAAETVKRAVDKPADRVEKRPVKTEEKLGVQKKQRILQPTGETPTIPTDLSSHTAKAARQQALDQFFAQFQRIYQNISALKPQLAKEHALEQERQLYLKSNQKTYATLRMGILRRLIKRPEAVDTRDVGIDGQYTARKQNIILESGQLALLDSLVMTQEQQTLHGYPTSIPEPSDALLVDHRQCDRCSNRYMIRDNHNSACTFHWSRMRSDKRDGQKIRLYRCCGQEKGSPGCSTGPHVFKLSDFSDLHTFVPFTRLSKTEKPMRLMALDCEMAYTEAGMELIRVTCLDHNGNIKLDELVKTQYPVLDLNSKWSGITSLETATKDLDDIKQQLSGLIDQTTILLGHGLENDLIALRLVHDSVIDTAQLFPHPTGLPFRYALRELSKQHLHRFIQDSSAGHDSKEDAMTCLYLVRELLLKRK